MSDLLLYHTIGILVLLYIIHWLSVVCFNAGAEYGKSKITPIVNIVCEETSAGFIFNELLSKAFICQTNDYSAGVDILTAKFPDKTIIVSVREGAEDESV